MTSLDVGRYRPSRDAMAGIDGDINALLNSARFTFSEGKSDETSCVRPPLFALGILPLFIFVMLSSLCFFWKIHHRGIHLP